MAGAILIAENNAVSFNSIEFYYIVEKIRENLLGPEGSIKNKIYEPMDEGGMSFISLEEQNKIGFNVFYRAAKMAYSMSLTNNQEKIFEFLWEELLDKLKLDDRWQG